MSTLPAPPPMMGVAPPMSGPPTSIPGPSKSARDKMMQAARLLFEAMGDEPRLTKELNEIIESLTTAIHQSAEPPAIPGGGSEGAGGTPMLDRTPAGPPTGGNSIAGGAGANPTAILSQLMGRG